MSDATRRKRSQDSRVKTSQPGVNSSIGSGPRRSAARDARLAVCLGLGALVGLAYAVVDSFSESRLERGTLTGVLAHLHVLVDRASPVIVGVLLGLAAYALLVRRELAAVEATALRAEALRRRLLKVERDQAIWVLAATVLHELNNPLHALGLLLDEYAIETDERRRAELVERVRVHADRARHQVAVLKSLRGRGEPRLERSDLASIVRSLAEDVGELVKDEGIRVHAECDAVVEARADATYVRTILENLIDNSLCVLRAEGGGSISVRLTADAERAIVFIADDGPAIDVETRAHLFEPLRSTKTHGLGLGLPIARALARAMRGDLALENDAGKLFRLELPLAAGPADTAVSPAAERAA
jgi:signal transduction histidine kinase